MKIDIDKQSQAIQVHLGILQGIIQRMAANSASSKAYCITLVSAILVILADKGKPDYAWISLIPVLLFFSLDVYYLGLEKAFRESYKDFIRKYHDNNLIIEDLFDVAPTATKEQIMSAIISFSIWPFYIVLLLMVWCAHSIVIPLSH